MIRILNSQFIENYANVKMYGEDRYKLTSMHFYKVRGEDDPKLYTAKGEAGNETKLDNNISRTKQRIYELAFCNPWEWFITLTLDPNKYDRTDLPKFKKDFGQMIRDYRKKTSANIKYLLIPERHQDGSWHMHGFIYGLPLEELHKFTLDEHIPYRIRERIEQGVDVYTWKKYEQKFGYAVFEQICNHKAVSGYITKYVTKDTMRTITELNAHAFYASKGLNSAEVIHQGTLEKAIDNPDFYGDYVCTKWFGDVFEALTHFTEEAECT